MHTKTIFTSAIWGVIASLLMLILYFIIVSLVSGFSFAQNQFASFWYFLLALILGFGIQIGMYMYLRSLVHHMGSGKIIATTGTTSTDSMISCCAHYLANILPVLGISALATLVAHYQFELFWLGILANLCGIVYMSVKINRVRISVS